jgi:glutamine amidotransferase
MKTVIIDYGAGNIKSVKFALERLGVNAQLSNDPKIISSADKVILPGVGEAGTAMDQLNKFGLDKLIPELKQPFLGICLGMQLMCEFTEEGDTHCLGIFPGKVLKFNTKLKVPQMGWNGIYNLKSPLFKQLKEEDYVYFIHSYYVPLSQFTIANVDYDIKFSAAIQKDNFYACQFHPEKSSETGQQILKNFIEL